MLIGVIAEELLAPIGSPVGVVSEAASATDVSSSFTGISMLVDDPASGSEQVDAYLGEIMLEAANASDAVDTGFVVDISEAATSVDTPDGSVISISASTWNPSDKSANIILSNGDLSAGTSSPVDGAVRSSISRTTGKLYFEVTWLTSSFGGDTGCGIATGAASLGSIGPTSSGALIAYAGTTGDIWFNGSGAGASIGFGGSAVVCFAIDLVNSRAWARINGGNWNGSGTANPATNTGGINIAALFPSNPAFVVIASNQLLNPLATINFGASAFAQSIPSGFTAWT